MRGANVCKHSRVELEVTIGNVGETTSEDEDDDEDYVENPSDDYDDYVDEELEIDMDEDFDEHGNYIGDLELAEAERLAAAADLAVDEGEEDDDDDDDDSDETEREGSQDHGYTLAIDCKLFVWSLEELPMFMLLPHISHYTPHLSGRLSR